MSLFESLKVIGLTIVFAFLVGCGGNGVVVETSSAKSSNKELMISAGLSEKLAESMSGIGLNNIETWTACESPSVKLAENQLNSIYNHGWSYVTFFECIDLNFSVYQGMPELKSLDETYVRKRARNLAARINLIHSNYPNLSIGISFKARFPVGGWGAKGIRQTHVNREVEKDDLVFNDYLTMLDIYSEEFSKVDTSSLFIVPMNEPEYHSIPNGREVYKSHITAMIDRIRAKLPEVVIMIEGVNKSLIGRGKTPESLMPIISRDKIVYGFHYYEPDNITHVKDGYVDSLPYDLPRKIQADMDEVIKFMDRYGVPVVLSEFGVWGETEARGKKSGLSHQARYEFVSTLLLPLIERDIGITWYALNDDNTPYPRSMDVNKRTLRFDKEPLLWKALFGNN